MTGEWVDWHRGYASNPHLIGRLPVVQARIREALDRAPRGPVRVVSLCAGDGRDLLGAVPGHPREHDVIARLIELDPDLARAARESATRQRLDRFEVVVGDASTTDAVVGAVPADLVLACGIFGNVTDADVRNTVVHLPELCAAGATVVWTRGRFEPDLTPAIRGWFRDAGFEELAFTPIPDTTAAVGANRLVGPPRPLAAGVRLFSFLAPDERPSRRTP